MMTIDESNDHIYVATSTGAVLKLQNGQVTDATAISGWTLYGISLSADNSAVVTVGHGDKGLVAVF